MKPSNTLRKSKEFPEQQTGSKLKQNIKEPKDFNSKQRKLKNNYSLEEDNCLSGDQPVLNNCMRSRCKVGKIDWDKKDSAFTKTNHEIFYKQKEQWSLQYIDLIPAIVNINSLNESLLLM